MWERSELKRPKALVALPHEARARFRELSNLVAQRSLITWGEHCTECAFPSCYTSCALYTPREDGHCRRFVKGIERVQDPADPKLDLVRIEFKRWGKLEGTGPLGLKPAALAHQLEWLDQTFTKPLSVFGRRVAFHVIWRLNTAKRRLAGMGRMLDPDDYFVIEAWHDGPAPLHMTLTILPVAGETDRLFQQAVTLAPGYSRTSVYTLEIARHVDLSQPFLVQIEPVFDGTPPIIFGIIDFVRSRGPSRSLPSPEMPVQRDLPLIKCVVWDLDNTLWRGTLVEDGVEGVEPIPEVVETIKALDRRGILNSIASKNDHDLAVEALTRFGLLDYFIFPQISWNPKRDAIRQIAEDIDIGTGTLAFIDDQPFERGEIRTFYPEVEVLPETAVGELLHMPRFKVPFTSEGSNRRHMYKTEERRRDASKSGGVDYEQFLRECRITLEVMPLSEANLLRVYELSQRTNQLNASGRRYTCEELEAMLIDAARSTYVLRCADRFGDYGIIGFCVLARESPEVESFFMSCRVQRKRVENAFFSLLADKLAQAGVDVLKVSFRKTDKNGATARVLTELGFKYEPLDGENRGQFVKPMRSPFPHSDIVSVERLGLAQVELGCGAKGARPTQAL